MPIRTLPLRWTPLAAMWARGDTIDDIAKMYSMTPIAANDYVKYLRSQYPGTFSERGQSAVLTEVKVQRIQVQSLRSKLAASVSTRRVQSFTPRKVERQTNRAVAIQAAHRIPVLSGQVRKRKPGDRRLTLRQQLRA